MEIIRANLNHLDAVSVLFDQYRQFYEQEPALEACKAFLQKRITNEDSIIFIAINEEGIVVGFTQLYPSFCSVELKPILYLYDLFVASSSRRAGYAKALMQRASDYAKELKVDRLTLETAIDNIPAQALYESIGYGRDNEFFTYHFEIE